MVKFFDILKPKKTPFTKFLPQVSPTIFLKPKKGFASISSQLQRIGSLPQPFKFLASPKLTTVLAGTLAGITGGFKAGFKTFGLVGLGLGIATTSPKAVEFIRKKAQPVAAGQFVGRTIETIGQPTKDVKTFKEKIKRGAKQAGFIGAGAAAGVAAVTAIKKIKGRAPKKLRQVIPQLPQTIIAKPFAQLPTESAPQFKPIGVAQKVPEEIQEIPKPEMPSIKNRINFNPEINIKFSKSRRFINQQVLVR